MAGWGIQSWGFGKWGLQGDELVQVTSVVDAPIAWNSGNFGLNNWGGQFNNIGISLGNESVTAEVNEGWGRLSWGENVWGGTGDVILSGNQINTSLGTPTGQQINISEGQADANPDANIIGEQLGIYSPGNVSISAEINSGWGRLGWGIFDWGGEGFSVSVAITGQQLNISQGNEEILCKR
jgi:hypothetical protein